MTNIRKLIKELNNKYNHNLKCIDEIKIIKSGYIIVRLSCKKCNWNNYIYLGDVDYTFDKEYNFTKIKKIECPEYIEYAYDYDILTCDEQIIKNIIE